MKQKVTIEVCDAGFRVMCEEILTQAIYDYKDLRRRGKRAKKTNEQGRYSIPELERFFKSHLCDTLLDVVGAKTLRGKTMLEGLRSLPYEEGDDE